MQTTCEVCSLFSRFALAIFDTSDFTLQMLGPTRLAKKYQVDWIVKKVASQLEKRWPTTLHGWDEIAQEEEDAAFRSFVGHWDESDTDPTLDRRRFPEPASSILLARECEVSTIVPFAFFNLVVWPSVLPDSPDDAYLLTACRNVPRMDLICPEDRLRIFEARELIARWFGAHRITAWKPCGSDMACQKRTSDTWFNLAVNIGHTGDFLRYSRYTEVQLNDSHCRDICPQCKKKLQDQIRKLRWDFVGELSAFLQLDDDA